ncbi:polyphosphate--glucose phosphotransferase [Asanoa siamensis]|nr:ROK family protein [Asanoa siamensis]
MAVIGIDIGGSGIKGALVDIRRGELVGERFRVDTPEPSNPKSVVSAVAEVVGHFRGRPERVGITFPGVISNGVVRTAANVDKSWMNTNGAQLFSQELHCPVALVNDADAAGMAEMEFGAGKGRKGKVVMLTFGTGIGSAVFIDGMLVPNTEFGHIKMHGVDAEKRAAARVRQDEDLGWGAWSKRVRKYLQHLEQLLSPDLFIVGGGVSRKSDNFLDRIDIETEVVPAMLLNNAGIIGAALATPQATEGRPMPATSTGARKTTGTSRKTTAKKAGTSSPTARKSAKSTTPRKSTASKSASTRKSTSPRTSTTASKSTSARKSATASKSTSARKSATASKSTSPRKSTTASKSTSPRKSTTASKSTSPRKSATASKSTSPRKSATASKSTSPRKSTAASKSTTPRKSTATRKSTTGRKSTARKAATPRKSSTARKAPATRKSTTARKSTAPRKASTGPARRAGTARKAGSVRTGSTRKATAARKSTSARKSTTRTRKTTSAARKSTSTPRATSQIRRTTPKNPRTQKRG